MPLGANKRAHGGIEYERRLKREAEPSNNGVLVRTQREMWTGVAPTVRSKNPTPPPKKLRKRSSSSGALSGGNFPTASGASSMSWMRARKLSTVSLTGQRATASSNRARKVRPEPSPRTPSQRTQPNTAQHRKRKPLTYNSEISSILRSIVTRANGHLGRAELINRVSEVVLRLSVVPELDVWGVRQAVGQAIDRAIQSNELVEHRGELWLLKTFNSHFRKR